MSYKLADGSDSSQYKVGDLFEHEKVGVCRLDRDDGGNMPFFRDKIGNSFCIDWRELKPLPKPFTKDDLKDGMIVQYRDGRERVIFNDSAWQVSEPPQTNRRAGRMKQVGHIHWLKSDLTHIDGLAHMDLVKVTDRDGTVLFQREPELIEKTIEASPQQWEKINEILEG